MIFLTIYGYASFLGVDTVDASWNGYLARATVGLSFSLPITAGIAAWSGNRLSRSRIVRDIGLTRSAFRIYWAQTWVLFLAILVAYGAAVLWQVVAVVPPATVPDFGLVFMVAGMAFVAIGFGFILGSLVHAAIAVPVAVFGLFEWIAALQMNTTNLSIRNITGYNVYGCCDNVYFVPDVRSVWAPVIVGVALLISAIAIAKLRRAIVLPIAVVLITASVVGSSIVVVGTQAIPRTVRPQTALQCAGRTPEMCLFPEQASDAVFIDYVKRSYKSAKFNNITLPPVIEAQENLARGQNPLRVTPLFVAQNLSYSQFVSGYSASLYSSISCNADAASNRDPYIQQKVEYAIALIMGVKGGAAVPPISTSVNDAPGKALSLTRIRQLLKIHSVADARTTLSTFLTDNSKCHGATR